MSPDNDEGLVATVSRRVNGALAVLASVSLMAMMVLIVGNMFRRTVTAPFPGTFEVVGWLAAITAALALGYTQVHKGHVDIDIVARLLPRRVQGILGLLVHVLSAAFFCLLAWRLWGMAGRLQAVGTVSESLRVAYHPFVYVVALGMLGLAVALGADAIHSARDVWRGRSSAPEDDAQEADAGDDAGPPPDAGPDGAR